VSCPLSERAESQFLQYPYTGIKIRLRFRAILMARNCFSLGSAAMDFIRKIMAAERVFFLLALVAFLVYQVSSST
jgi:hypothetical protein